MSADERQGRAWARAWARALAAARKPEAQRKKRIARHWEYLIEPAYETHANDETGRPIHIIDVPVYTASLNEQKKAWKADLKWWHEGQQLDLVELWDRLARKAVDEALLKRLPHWAFDQDTRESVNYVVLHRVGPQALDAHDNLRGALKGVCDTVFAWLKHGPMYDRLHIGHYDDCIYDPATNPGGKMTLVYTQTIRALTRSYPVGRYGVRIELHRNAIR